MVTVVIGRPTGRAQWSLEGPSPSKSDDDGSWSFRKVNNPTIEGFALQILNPNLSPRPGEFLNTKVNSH